MDNKHRKLFVIKRSKGCKFMPKMHQKYVWRPGSTWTRWGSLCALPDSVAAMGAYIKEGRKEGERGRKGREGSLSK